MTVSLIFDIVIVAICLFFVIRYAIRGFVRSLMALVKAILAPLVAIIFCTPLGKVISNAFFLEWGKGTVRGLLESTLQSNGTYALHTIVDGIPNWFINLLTSGLDQETTDKLWLHFVNEEPASAEVVEEFTEILGTQFSLLIGIVIAFVAIFIVAELIFLLVGFLLNQAAQVSIVKTLNVILGALIGAVIAAFVAMLVSLAIEKVFEFGYSYYPNIFNMDYVNNTVIVKFFKDDFWEWVKGIAIK
ncbi:MAG: CvpA family protein [Clostridia bacterium]|nr:CvpA family protein [Clostridia bacterium]